MNRRAQMGLLVALSLAVGSCAGDVPPDYVGSPGTPCVPDEELRTDFGGYSWDEVNLGSQDADCAGHGCLVFYFQGRVTCPYGQSAPDGGCKTSDGEQNVSVPVPAQLEARRPSDSVYCTCRCAGYSNADYCQCPSGFTCTHLFDELGFGLVSEVGGSYCTKNGLDAPPPADTLCDRTTMSCD